MQPMTETLYLDPAVEITGFHNIYAIIHCNTQFFALHENADWPANQVIQLLLWKIYIFKHQVSSSKSLVSKCTMSLMEGTENGF